MQIVLVSFILLGVLLPRGDFRPFTRHSYYERQSNLIHCHSVNVYLNGHVYTVDKQNDANWNENPKEAIVVVNEHIRYLGQSRGALNFLEHDIDDWCQFDQNSELHIYDLKGFVILPGFHDIHMHPLEARSPVGGTCKLPRGTDPLSNEMREEFIRCRKKQIGTEWLLGSGHSITNLLEHVTKQTKDVEMKSPKEILDDYIQDETIPAIMLEETSHSIWVNSEALRRANINKYTEPRPGGVIMRDQNGEPNGILLENEVQNMMDLAFDLEKYPALEDKNYEGLYQSLSEISEYGITSLCDARVYWKRGHLRAWKRACYEGILNARTILGLWAYPHFKCVSSDEDCDRVQIEELKDMYSKLVGDCDLRISQIKMYSDGLLDSYTAAMAENYSSVMEGLPGLDENKGLNYFTEDRMRGYIRELQHFRDKDNNDVGFDFNIHAIGDRGISETLNAISASQENGNNNGERHRITHVEVTNPKDHERFAKLGVIADFQVAGDFTLPTKEHRYHYKHLIGDRYNNFISVQSIRNQGAEDLTTFSSDWDVSPLNPFIGIEHAIHRGNESVDIKTAIEMYTINPAFAMRQEYITGSLVVGKEADFIVIDKNILQKLKEDEKISNTFVLRTILKGRSVFTSKHFERCVEDHAV